MTAKKRRCTSMEYTFVETPIGRLYAAHAEKVLCFISADEEQVFTYKVNSLFGAFPNRGDQATARLVTRILTTIVGEKPYDGPMSLSILTSFQRAVLNKAIQIPRGEVRSYAWIANALQHPLASRAVGTALARNPLPYIIPCHRVICSDGRLGYYSGGGGTEMKARLLAYEGINIQLLNNNMLKQWCQLKHEIILHEVNHNNN